VWTRIPSIIKGMTLVNGQAAGRQTGTAGAGFVARIEGDDLPQPPKVWIRQLPDDTGTLAADREPHEHASDRDPGLVPRPLQQLSLCYANPCAARLESGES
jgi:hypothetical protein